MELNDFARSILLGSTLEEKLTELKPGWIDTQGATPLSKIPDFPGRPARLARIGKAEFPDLSQLNRPESRGQVLHFFANHELLAMELMALLLLRFPDAPPAFRASIARTISEEQSHMNLYIGRMRELDVDFGELSVSAYFWNAMKDMTSPLQFVTQMSLTLEQANLDYCLFYKEAVEHVGDEKTAAILDCVYREEIGHVKNGLVWFNKWRAEGSGGIAAPVNEDDWDAYLRLLPPPMTARRAKGISFSPQARREAGFSERFIRELDIYAGSKGRPPVFWFYNPLCDFEIVRGRPGLNPTEPVRRLNLDLEYLPMFLASDQDIVLVCERPRIEWLKQMGEVGFQIPEFRDRGRPAEFPRETKIGGIEPWGWSPEVFERFRSWRERLIQIEGGNGLWSSSLLSQESFTQTGLAHFFSKSWSVQFFRDWLNSHPEDELTFGEIQDAGTVYTDSSGAFNRIRKDGSHLLLAKAPWGTSGTQNKRIMDSAEANGPLGGWIRNTIQTQGSVVIEPWLDKLCDLSLQMEIREDEVRLLGIRRFVTGTRLDYRGTHLNPTLSTLEPEWLRYLHSPPPRKPDEPSPLERWKALALALGQKLQAGGYRGPAGIDAMLWKTSEEDLRLKPLVELNPRWTMGRVALELETHIAPGTSASWLFIPVKEILERGYADTAAFASEMESRHPLLLVRAGAGMRLAEGVLFTNDPRQAREILTVLVIDEKALAEPVFQAQSASVET